MRPSPSAPFALAAFAALAGCEPAPTSAPDASPDDAPDVALDAPSDDAPDASPDVAEASPDAPDAPEVDAGPRCPELPPEPPAQTGAVCDAANVVDLTTLRPGEHHFGWVNAPTRPEAQLLTDGCAVRGARTIGRQVVHRYRMRTTAHLRASTNHLGSYCGPGGVRDTLVGIYRACTPAAPVPLGCASDDLFDVASPATVTSGEPVPAGAEVFVAVSALSQGRTSGFAAYELSLDEVPAPTPGGPCLPEAGGPCPAGHTCVSDAARPSEFSQVGRCVANGTEVTTECRPADATPRCDDGLTCAPFTFVNGQCLRRHAPGEACDGHGDVCSRYPFFNCVPDDPADPTASHCLLDGSAAGAICPDGMCPEGLTCVGSGVVSTCRTVAADGAPCDPWGRRVGCAPTSFCVPDRGGFVCRPDGTAAGARCRDDAPRCDPSLTCTTATGRGYCGATLGADATSCDPRTGATRCPDGRVCLATGATTGRCVVPTREGDGDNNHPSLAEPVTLPAAIRGALPTGGDVDCFAFDLPAGAVLRAETNDGLGTCPPDADTVLTIHDAAGRAIDGSDDAYGWTCSVVDGAWARSPLRGLAAGRYTACVWSFRGEAPVGEYYLNVTAGRP